jgi:endonuclease/exonuclease/phosphatase family metal-dependent hydrolase
MAGAASGPAVLRVLSYNVRSLRDDTEALASVIRACEPDIVCVQEAPRFLRWRSKCAALARTSGLVVVTGGRPAGSMLLLARLGVDVHGTRDALLSRTPGLHQRGLAIADVEVGGARYVVAAMHLGLRADERLRHVDEVLDLLSPYDQPVVLAGDLNERPGEPVWSLLAEQLQDAWVAAGGDESGTGGTYRSDAPYERIDGVFADRRLRVVSCEVPDQPEVARASDHRPVLAVVAPR